MSRSLKFIIFALLAVTSIPYVGGHYFDWSWEYITRFYWGAGGGVIFLIFLTYYAKHLLVFFVILLLSAAVFSLDDSAFWGNWRVPATFWGLYALCWPVYFYLSKTKFGLWLRTLHPFKHFMIYLCFMAASMGGSFALTVSIFHGWDLVPQIPANLQVFFVSTAALIPTLTIGILKVIDMIGADHVVSFLFGVYHRPQERKKVVLFLDMVGSTKIAERLPPKTSMALIAQFIFDASYVFRLHGGDISNYTGDGLVVIWPMRQADKALDSVWALQGRLNKNRTMYERQYGTLPTFRIGIHAGDVVMSQIGEERLFLGLYGDVVNIAARLEQMNKELGTKLLFSEEVLKCLKDRDPNKYKDMGTQELQKGAGRFVRAFTLKKATAAN